MDELSKQLVGEVHAPIPAAPGHGQIIDPRFRSWGVRNECFRRMILGFLLAR